MTDDDRPTEQTACPLTGCRPGGEGEAPSPADLGRDLAADLAAIEKHQRYWDVALAWMGRTKYAYPELEQLKASLPVIAAAAIRRALAAEAEVNRLRGIVAGLTDRVAAQSDLLTRRAEK